MTDTEDTCANCERYTDFELCRRGIKCNICGRSGSHLLPIFQTERGGFTFNGPPK